MQAHNHLIFIQFEMNDMKLTQFWLFEAIFSPCVYYLEVELSHWATTIDLKTNIRINQMI